MGFSINGGLTHYYSDYVYGLEKNPINAQTLAQLRKLKHVDSLKVSRDLPVVLMLDQVPRYAMLEHWDQNFGMLDEAMYAESLLYTRAEEIEHLEER